MAEQVNSGKRYKDKEGSIWIVPAPYVRKCDTKLKAARMFIAAVTAFNDISIGPMELNFLAYIMLRGGVLSGTGRKQYIDEHGSSKSKIDNMVSGLKKKKVLVKSEDRMVRLHPKIVVNFKDNDNFIFTFRCLTK